MKYQMGEHPRIITNKAQLKSIRNKISDDTVYARFYQLLKDKCERYIAELDLDYRIEDESDGWQRAVGNALMNYVAVYAAGGEERYLKAALTCGEKICSYPTWGRGQYLNSDLSAAHELFAISMMYDWLGDELSPKTLKLLRETAVLKAEYLFKAANDERTFWSFEWLQNHMWIDVCALAAAAIAFYEDAPNADKWLDTAISKYDMTMKYLPKDGASHEGYLYWQYGADWMIKFMLMAKTNLGVDYFNTEWFRNTASYGIYLLLPSNMRDNGENIYADMADSDRCNKRDYYEGQDHLMYKLANIYRDGFAQSAGKDITEAQLPITSWKCLFYYDETIKEIDIKNLPKLKHFDDMGIVVDRSGWDGNESLLMFRCAPYLGHSVYDAYDEKKFRDWGGGHVHPDVNHFTLFGCGEAIMCDDGYSHKHTSNHSLLLVDGHGQAGEGWIWFGAKETHLTEGKPKILHIEQGDGFDYFVCDGRYAYPSHLGLERFVRRFLFVKPNVLLVADDIATDEIRCMELRLVPGAMELKAEGGEIFAYGKKTITRIVSTYPIEIAGKAFYLGRKTTYHNTPELAENKKIFLQTIRDDKWLTAAAISFASLGEKPPAPKVLIDNGKFVMELAGKTYTIDSSNNKICVK